MTMTTLVTQQLSTQSAIELGCAAIAHAESLGIAISVSVVCLSGKPLASLRMNRSPLISADLAHKKAFTALSFQQPTLTWQAKLREKPEILAALQSEPLFSYLGGGLPIFQGLELVGAIGVSGGSEQQDIECASTALVNIQQEG